MNRGSASSIALVFYSGHSCIIELKIPTRNEFYLIKLNLNYFYYNLYILNTCQHNK